MAAQNIRERRQGADAQNDFRDAGNANIVRQAGEGLESQRSSAPVPGNRLTGADAEAEAGRPPDQGDPARPRGSRQLDTEAKIEEKEALRRQGQNETDSPLDQQSRPQGSTPLEDPIITSNPD